MRSACFLPRLIFASIAFAVVAQAAAGPRLQAQMPAATFTVLPYVDPDWAGRGDFAFEVTNQGLVAGYGYVDNGLLQAVRWEANGAVTSLGVKPNYHSSVAHSLSGNGQVVCGVLYDDVTTKAFVWTPAQGIRHLLEFAPEPSEARVVSDDGSTIWGAWETTASGYAAMRWDANTLTNVGIYQIGDFPVQVGVFDASADGKIGVGFETTEKYGQRATRLTPSGGEFLPKVEGSESSVAYGTTPDGSVVVGYGGSEALVTSFIWEQGKGIRNLPLLKPTSTVNRAFDIAENGTIVGQDISGDWDPEDETAMLWIAERPFTLQSYLGTQFGLDVSDWKTIQAIRSISRNGRVMAGYGLLGGRTRAFRVTIFGNIPPVANAGVDVRKDDAAPGGVNVKLDGRKSIDPDGVPVTYRWSGIRFESKTSARPTAKFPVGTTTVTLKVTDAAGVSATDTVRVIVKAKRSKIRPQGLAANEAFSDAATLTETAGASAETNEAVLIALENVAAAEALGAAIGDAYVWGQDEAPEEVAADYFGMRLMQSAYGHAASAPLARAYIETGDPAYSAAYRSARLGTLRALADLANGSTATR